MSGLSHSSALGMRVRTPLARRTSSPFPTHSCNRRVVQTKARLSPSMDSEALGEYTESDFYSILGVSPHADRRAIKQAYYGMMRECHPDAKADSNDFCVILNEIYATLSDPCKRSVYNDMAGFSENATNPFTDSTAEQDLVFVDEASCIGCTNCCGVCPATFALEDDWGRARVMDQRVDSNDKLQEAIDCCPVTCIHWVSANQIPLLESAMSKMDRAPVWVLMSGGGQMLDVFSVQECERGVGIRRVLSNLDRYSHSNVQYKGMSRNLKLSNMIYKKDEASLAWAKRQSRIKEQVIASRNNPGHESSHGKKPPSGSWWSWDTSYVDMAGASGAARYSQPTHTTSYSSYDSMDDVKGSRSSQSTDDESAWDPVGPREARDIAGLAARASRAARTWKKYQEVLKTTQGGKQTMLPPVLEF